LDRHYFRKHGKNAYYGQNKKQVNSTNLLHKEDKKCKR
jgi:hypothetical protein